MDKSELRQILQEQDQKKDDGQIIRRECEDAIRETPFVLVISGLRRVGKSTLLRQLRKKRDGHFMNFDDERLIGFTIADFQPLLELMIELYGEKDTFYFDEIQNIHGWERFVRRLYDSNKKVYVTGSNANLLSKELGTHLTGRYTSLCLYPFSFKEYLIFRGISIESDTTQGRASLKKAFHKYILEGGLPDYLKTGDTDYLKTLYQSIIYKDVLARYKLTAEKTLKELVQYIASNAGKEQSYNALRKTLSIGSPTTVKEYLGYLENTYLLFLIPQQVASFKKQLYANKKAYIIDTALATTIGSRMTKDAGRLLENVIFLALQRHGKDIAYYRGDGECDFVGNGYAIQSCLELTTENKTREINGLLAAMKTLRIMKGHILTLDQEETIKQGRRTIRIMPVWKWLLS
ncbi:MAG: ATP-binding protein [Nanoarchaeota archaeon]